MVIFCQVVVPSSAQTGKIERQEKLIEEIQEKSSRISTLTAEFTQVRTLSLFANPISFKGKIAIERPDKLRWEFTSPLPSVLIFNENKGLRCVPDSAPVAFDLKNDPIMRLVAEQLWVWLKGDYQALEKEYDITLADESALQLTPAGSTRDFIERITINFNAENRQPQKVRIEEPQGDMTTITFTAYQLNRPLPSALFSSCLDRE